jgi:starvation-inducible DNA-binding protein
MSAAGPTLYWNPMKIRRLAMIDNGRPPTTTTQTHLPPLGAHVREEVGGELEATLIDLIDLTLWGKQLHWTVAGPLFHPLHERLDELVDSWRDLADTIAERAVAVGYWPDGQAQAVAAGEDRTAIERGPVEDQVVLRLLARRLAEVSERARRRLDRLGELDVVSQDVMIEVVRTLEQQLWMSRAQLPGRTHPGGA